MLLEVTHALLDEATAHEGADDRFIRFLDHSVDRLCRFHHVGHRLRRENHHQAVHVRALEQDVRRGPVALAGGVSDHVHGIADGRGGWQVLAQRVLGLVGEFGQFQTGPDRRVGGQDARTSRIGDDRHLLAARHRNVGVGLGEVEQFLDRPDALDAALQQQRLVDRVGPGQRPGVRRGGAGALCGATGLDGQHRLLLLPEDLATDVDELPAGADVLEVHADDLGLGVVTEVAQQVDLVHVGLVAEADELRESEVVQVRVVQHRGADRARLGDEGQVAAPGNLQSEGGVHRDIRGSIDDAQAVRTDQRDAVLLHLLLDRILDLGAFRPDLLETGGDGQDRLHALLGRLVDHTRDELRRNDQHGHLDVTFDRGEAGVGLDAMDVIRLVVHRVDRALESTLEEVQEDVVSDGSGAAGGAHHSDRSGAKQRLDVLGHRRSLIPVFPRVGRNVLALSRPDGNGETRYFW